jgi:predicted  nucleic acid-binding Zn-ribbon protein
MAGDDIYCLDSEEVQQVAVDLQAALDHVDDLIFRFEQLINPPAMIFEDWARILDEWNNRIADKLTRIEERVGHIDRLTAPEARELSERLDSADDDLGATMLETGRLNERCDQLKINLSEVERRLDALAPKPPPVRDMAEVA